MNRRGLRKRWQLFSSIVKDFEALGVTKQYFVSKEEGLKIATELSKDPRNGKVEVRRVLVGKEKL